MYPLPPELSEKIMQAIADARAKFDGDLQEQLHDAFAKLLVRENRRMRQQIGVFWRNLSEAADRDDGEYGDIRAAAGGEFTCEYIVNEILKPNVYFKEEEEDEDNQDIIDRIIQDFYEEDDGLEI